MSERKAINKYYPPDYNPIAAEKALKKSAKTLKTRQKDVVTIRLMTPFSMRCLKCSEYIPQSRKFNGKKQLLPERYLNTIKVFRLSIRCPRCNHVISFRTDPKTADYVMEGGAERNGGKAVQEQGQVESAEQTLERLVRERKAADHAALGGNSGDRHEQLEARLAQTQREQQQEEELERLLLQRKRVRSSQGDSGGDSSENESDLEQAAEAAFKNRAPLPRPATTASTGAVVPRNKRAKKKNPLGVRRRS